MSQLAQGPQRPAPAPTAAVPAGPPAEALAQAAAAKAAEAAGIAADPPSPGRERGANGRFVPKAAAPAPVPVPLVAQEVLPAPQNNQASRESFIAKHDQILNNASQITAGDDAPDESAEELQQSGEASQTVDPAGNSEGPSAELRMIAERVGVSPLVLDMATSDEALRIAIAMAVPSLMDDDEEEELPQVNQQQRQPQGRQQLLDEELQIKLLLDPENTDPEDPYYKQAKHTVDRVAELQEVVAELAAEVLSQRKRQAVSQRDEIQKVFDDTLDATGWKEVGKKAELKSAKQAEVQYRVALFPAFKKLRQVLPDLPSERVVELAYEQVFGKRPAPKQSPKEAARIEALKQSNAKILGSGSGGPPAPERPLTPREKFEKKFNALINGGS